MNLFDLSGRVAVITDSNGGIRGRSPANVMPRMPMRRFGKATRS